MMTETRASLQHTIGRNGLLVIRLTDADVRLRGVDGDDVTVQADGDLDQLTVERGEGSLSIRGAGRSEPELAIDVPAAASIVVETRSGDIAASGVIGATRWTTASGDVRLEAVQGDLTAEAVSGDVAIAASGPLEATARTVSGDLELRGGTVGRLEVATTSGDITLSGRFLGDGPFTVETVSGDTMIESIGPVWVGATTLTGDIHGPRPEGGGGKQEGRVVGMSGGPTIAFRSTSGDLSLSVSDDDEAALDRPAAVGSGPDAPVVDPDLEILRALERGEIDVDAATAQLAALEEG